MNALARLRASLEERYGLRWDDERARHADKHLGATHSSGDPLQDGLDALLIGETYFFRYPFYLQVLQRRLLADPGGGPFRVLCPACSTGEEAYSVAFALLEAGREGSRAVEVIAADARQSAIAVARRAVYGRWSLRNTTAEQRERFLEPLEGETFRVREPYRSLPCFERRNLLEAPPPGPFDAVLVPNATLYMHEEAASRTYSLLGEVLRPEGVLLLAPTDPLPRAPWRVLDDYPGWAVFSRTPAVRPPAPRPEEALRRPERRAFEPARPLAAQAPPAAATAPPARAAKGPAAAAAGSDDALWSAWAEGRLDTAHDRIREKVFLEPEDPLWRFLYGAVLWERGWLRRARKEMEASARLLEGVPEEASVRGLCTARELRRMVAFWSEQHG